MHPMLATLYKAGFNTGGKELKQSRYVSYAGYIVYKAGFNTGGKELKQSRYVSYAGYIVQSMAGFNTGGRS